MAHKMARKPGSASKPSRRQGSKASPAPTAQDALRARDTLDSMPVPARTPDEMAVIAQVNAASGQGALDVQRFESAAIVRPGLNRARGEFLSDLGPNFEIVPLSKWADTSIWTQVLKQAEAAFSKAGCQVVVNFREADVLVQEYRSQDVIAFIFHRRVPVLNWRTYRKQGGTAADKSGKSSHGNFGNRDLYKVVRVRLSPQLRSALIVAGRWTPARSAMH